MNSSKEKKTVFVGVSGGVDSSVACAILKEQNYNVVGVFIRTWTPDFIECTWRDERRDAMRVCAHFNIPFLECDAEEAYKKGVADYMIEEYKKGRTPNPDVMCNREVKFGVFWDFAKKNGADFIATGHYAVNDLLHTDSSFRSSLSLSASRDYTRGSGAPTPVASQGLSVLRKSPDLSKDQSYFLWTLRQEDLAHTLFPVGHLNKTDVRKLAKKYKIPVAEKKDSQGVCFLGPLDMKDFLKHYIESKRGDVLLACHDNDLEGKNEIIGYHDGAVFFTLGERHGFTITQKSGQDKPYYVIGKDIEKNTITVSPKSDLGLTTSPTGGQGSVVRIMNTNWIIEPNKDKNYTCQIRYHGEVIFCKIKILEDKKAEIIFGKSILVDKGQSIVFYDGDICLGGGVVE